MKHLFIFCACLVIGACTAHSDANAATHVLVPQKGAGAPYGTRDPYNCSTEKVPQRGAITPAMAAQYFTCRYEHLDSDGYIWLAENVKVEVGKPISKIQEAGLFLTDADPDSPVYPIRGSFDGYFCGKANDNPGHNCTVWHKTHATGHCYRTGFGDWNCMMTDLDGQQIGGQAPPQK